MREPIPVGPISIGPFQLDPASHSVTRADRTLLPLGTRAMDLLLVLARANGEVVSKAVIMDAVWPGLVVEENNIQVQVSALRRASNGSSPSPPAATAWCARP